MAERELKATLAEKRDGVGIITLNRPEKLNAINQDIMDDLYYLFDAYEEDPEVRVIVLTGGDGKAFCAGGDIEGEIQMDVVGSYHGGIEGNRLNTRIEKCRIPVIAAINGFCLGGGFEMALACDIRLASERARIGLTEVNMGVIPGSGGTQRLPRLIGPSRAKLLMMTGNHYKGEAALAMGLVDMVFPAEELLDAAVNMAKEMAAKPPLALEYVKWAVNEGMQMDLDRALLFESALQHRGSEGSDVGIPGEAPHASLPGQVGNAAHPQRAGRPQRHARPGGAPRSAKHDFETAARMRPQRVKGTSNV